MAKKWRGWLEGTLKEDLKSLTGTGHKKGDIVRYKKFKTIDDSGYEYHYLNQDNCNLVRTKDLLI